jgi:MoaA/NifB/PqqE/SkfB family radical SAM enzyme
MKIDSIGIFLTRRCNFRCIYCCTETGADPSDKMTFEELKETILQAKALGTREIVIPGEGEPFLDENLFPLIDFAVSNGLKIKIFTNGALIDRYKAAILFKKKVNIIFKLHSLDRKIYDCLAGKSDAVNWTEFHNKNNVNKIIKIPSGLKYLLEAGYGNLSHPLFSETLLQIETVVVEKNLRCVPIIAQLCNDLGIDCMVETLIGSVTSDNNASVLGISSEEELKLFNALKRIMGWKFIMRQKLRCRFETNPFIDVSGNIRYCFCLPADIGNIRNTPLAVLHNKELSFRKSIGMISKKIDIHRRGFRYCASRKALNGCFPEVVS